MNVMLWGYLPGEMLLKTENPCKECIRGLWVQSLPEFIPVFSVSIISIMHSLMYVE